MAFLDRQEAGRRLVPLVREHADASPLVLGLPRGGVVVGYEIAAALGAPLDVWVVRKVGAPDFPELGLGAVAEGGQVFLDRETIGQIGASEEQVRGIVRQETEEVARRITRYRQGRPPPALEGRTVVLVDDGIATGGTVRAAVQALRAAGARRIVLAVPVASTQALEQLEPLVDAVACLHATPALYAIGAWYEDFAQVPEDDVVALLERARAGARPGAPEPDDRKEQAREVAIPAGDVTLKGTLTVPLGAKGMVLFAHGSGSSRLSYRNRHVASVLSRRGLSTLLFDLLTPEEEALDERTAELRFDVDFLAYRLGVVTDWVRGAQDGKDLPVGYFGSSTGAAAALLAAAERPDVVRAVVSRGGRPDLAWDALATVRAPTLLIVGARDEAVIELNHRAHAQLTCPKAVAIVPGAGHLFEEPGALDAVARLAGDWFERTLPAGRALEAPGDDAGTPA